MGIFSWLFGPPKIPKIKVVHFQAPSLGISSGNLKYNENLDPTLYELKMEITRMLWEHKGIMASPKDIIIGA